MQNVGGVGGEDGPAPQLKDVRLERDEARRLFEDVLGDVERMLSHNRIHGDLSPFKREFASGCISIRLSTPTRFVPATGSRSIGWLPPPPGIRGRSRSGCALTKG